MNRPPPPPAEPLSIAFPAWLSTLREAGYVLRNIADNDTRERVLLNLRSRGIHLGSGPVVE